MTAGWVNWRRRLALAFAMAVAVASFAGLRAAASESATAATASRSATESIVNFAYRPTPLTVSAGTKVVFSNQTTGTTHTATQNGGHGFRTGRIGPGQTASVTFKRPGTYFFHCSIHPFMHGKIVVE